MELVPYIFFCVMTAYLIYLYNKFKFYSMSNVLLSFLVTLFFIVHSLIWLGGLENTLYWVENGQVQSTTINYTNTFIGISSMFFAIMQLIETIVLYTKRATTEEDNTEENSLKINIDTLKTKN